MYPEVMILTGAAIGVGVGNVALMFVQSAWWRHRVAVWWFRRIICPRRLAEVRRTTWQTRAYATAPRDPWRLPAAVPEQCGRHRAGVRTRTGVVGVRRPAPATRTGAAS